jgi:hypothetical protein
MLEHITQLPMTQADIDKAQNVAARMGYKQTVYTSTSAIEGLYCLKENPAYGARGQITRGGVFFKTAEFGLVFLQDLEDLNAS